MALTNAQMQAIINGGGSVEYRGAVITRRDLLPTDAQIAVFEETLDDGSDPSPLQDETREYLAEIEEVGSYIALRDLLAWDTFVSTGKQSGFWDKLLDVWVGAGRNLAASLVKGKAAPGTPSSLVAHNLDGTNYVPGVGIRIPTSNANKYLSTGVIPSAHGLGPTNMTLVFAVADATPGVSSGYLAGTNPASGDSDIVLNSLGDIGIGGNLSAGVGLTAPFVKSIHYGVGTRAAFHNGVQDIDHATNATTSSLNTEFTIFRNTRFGTTYFQTGSVGFYAIGSNMTTAEALALNQAVVALLQGLGRMTPQGSKWMYFGDSITARQGATVFGQGFSSLLSRYLGVGEINAGRPSSQLRQTVAGVMGGSQRHAGSLGVPHDTKVYVFGTNDANADAGVNGTPATLADFQTKYEAMIQADLDAGRRVLVGSLPYNSTSPATRLVPYVAACAAAAKAKGVPFVDLYNPFLDTGAPASYMTDANHPGDPGHALMAGRFLALSQGRIYRDVTLDFPSVAVGAAADLTVTMYNAVPGQTVHLGLPAAPAAGLVFSAWVSANDTVTVRAFNPTGGAIDPASAFYRVTVLL